jgi:hypothetical protein
MPTKKIFKLSIICLLIINIFYFSILTVNAEPLLNADSGNLNKDTECMKNGNCQLNDFVQIALNVSEIILGLVGSLALLAFIVGGVMWMISAGNAEMVTRGKNTIIGAVVGLAIVFTSFMIIQLVYSALGIEKAAGGKWAVSSWFK